MIFLTHGTLVALSGATLPAGLLSASCPLAAADGTGLWAGGLGLLLAAIFLANAAAWVFVFVLGMVWGGRIQRTGRVVGPWEAEESTASADTAVGVESYAGGAGGEPDSGNGTGDVGSDGEGAEKTHWPPTRI